MNIVFLIYGNCLHNLKFSGHHIAFLVCLATVVRDEYVLFLFTLPARPDP